jgi:hypothetical protein
MQNVNISMLKQSQTQEGKDYITQTAAAISTLFNPYKLLFSSVARNNLENHINKFDDILIDIAKNTNPSIREILTNHWLQSKSKPSFIAQFIFYTSVVFLIICPMQTAIIIKLYKK